MCLCVYNLMALSYTWNQHNIGSQLYFSLKKGKETSTHPDCERFWIMDI